MFISQISPLYESIYFYNFEYDFSNKCYFDIVLVVNTTAKANAVDEKYENIQSAISSLAKKIKGVVEKQNEKENNEKMKNPQISKKEGECELQLYKFQAVCSYFHDQ